jgi:putative ABC transport system permease protein
MSTLLRDVRYGLVTMRRSPWFTCAALSTLALGIGATTLIFTVVYGLLIRPLPYPDSDQLVRIWEEHPGGTTLAGNRWLSNRTVEGWASPGTIEGVGAYSTSDYTVRIGEEPERLMGARASPAAFALLRAVPAIGRLLTDEDVETPTTLVISDQLWRERFNRSPDVLGKRIKVDEDWFTIVGVTPPDWRFPERRTRFWTPYVVPTSAAVPTRVVNFTAFARLKPGASLAQVEAEGTSAARSVSRPMADFFFGKGGPVVVHARPLADDFAAPARPAVLVLAAAVGCLLLMACANVANLLLSRGLARERELAVRFAIGGSTWRIVRQLLTESVVLSCLGGALGVLLASWLLALLPAIAPTRLPRVDDMRLDWRVLLFALGATLVCAIVAGLAPAIRGARIDLAHTFRGGDGSSRSGIRGRTGRHTRDVLLIAESAIAVMLLVAAGLLARSFMQLTMVDPGYTADGVLVAQIRLSPGGTPERYQQTLDALLTEMRALPGVRTAGASNMAPLTGMTAMSTFTISGTPGAPDATTARARTYVVTPDFAQTVGIRLRDGRLFTHDDVRAPMRPLIVNEAFVRQYLADGSPVIGRVFGDMYTGESGTHSEIIGVVGNTLKDGNDASPEPEIFRPIGWPAHAPRERLGQFINLVARTSGDPSSMIAAVRNLLRETDREMLIDRLEPLSTSVYASMAQPRFAARTIGAFALVALLLAAVGLFGVLSYTVAERRRELGIRAAMGAHRGSLLGLVMREGLTVTAIGVGVGLLGAAALTRFMQSALFGVTPLDPLSFAIGPLLLIPIAAIACLGPALRAASADPATVLRAS